MSQYFSSGHKVTFVVWFVANLANLAWSTVSIVMFLLCIITFGYGHHSSLQRPLTWTNSYVGGAMFQCFNLD